MAWPTWMETGYSVLVPISLPSSVHVAVHLEPSDLQSTVCTKLLTNCFYAAWLLASCKGCNRAASASSSGWRPAGQDAVPAPSPPRRPYAFAPSLPLARLDRSPPRWSPHGVTTAMERRSDPRHRSALWTALNLAFRSPGNPCAFASSTPLCYSFFTSDYGSLNLLLFA